MRLNENELRMSSSEGFSLGLRVFKRVGLGLVFLF